MIKADRNLIVAVLTADETARISECIEEAKKIGVDLSSMNQATHKGCIFSFNRPPVGGLYKCTENIWQELQLYGGLRLELSAIRLQDYMIGLMKDVDNSFDLRKSDLLQNGRHNFHRDHGSLAQSRGTVEIVNGFVVAVNIAKQS